MAQVLAIPIYSWPNLFNQFFFCVYVWPRKYNKDDIEIVKEYIIKYSQI